ncbi:NAD-dependent epimerase/dehydratase family protein, partial [Erwinia amylovora]|uniref:NAD-dependent epimerase/dehydratase family protein n=1 Tax=Erwinia amylovora TaxID=552 RepID=UPI00200AC11E
MNILITGAGGYIPTGLIKVLLEKGHKVIGVDNGFGRGLDGLIEFCSNSNFTFIKGDISSQKILNQIEGKFHIAVLAH